MKMPNITKTVGKTDSRREVYIEEYVITYLTGYKKRNAEPGSPVILYGKKENAGENAAFIVYGAGERDLVKEGTAFSQLEELGCLNMEFWEKSENAYEGIMIGNRNGGYPIEGYHLFYEENEMMKEYLSLAYRKEGQVKTEPENREIPGNLFYAVLRAAVILIFIILCAIAVSTLNSYGKMKEFTQTAVQMGEYKSEIIASSIPDVLE